MVLLDLDLASRFDEDSGSVLLGGIGALVRLPMQIHRHEARAGRRTATFISGYQGSPLGGYDSALAREAGRLDAHQVHNRPAVNEELAATSVWGSQQVTDPEGLDGIVGLWYGKSPGLDRAGDAIRHANAMGVSATGGAVLLVGDDPACKSSTIPSASEAALADLSIPVLVPGSAQEVLMMGLHAVALSRFTGGWTALKIVTDVADGFGSVDLDVVSAVAPRLPSLDIDGQAWQPRQAQTTPPGSVGAERQVLRGRRIAAQHYAAANSLDLIQGATGPASIGLVAAGKTYLDLREALGELGLKGEEDLQHAGVRLLKVAMPYPLEPDIVKRFAAGLSEVVVLEEKRPFMESAIREILYGTHLRPRIVGEQDEHGRVLIPVDGELTVGRLLQPLRARLGATRLPPSVGGSNRTGSPADPPSASASIARGPQQGASRALPLVSSSAATRGPWFCSGCPHNRSTVVPEGSSVGAGIGCHAMVQMSGDDRRTADTITQMGGEGAQWIGMAPFAREGHAFQNLGDGTYFHSGSLAIRAAVAAGVSITFKLLHNGAVAMTGGQQATGGRPLHDMVLALLAEGVVGVAVVASDPARIRADGPLAANATLHDRDELDEVQRRLQQTAGVTVMIYDQECAAEARRDRKRGTVATPTTRVMVNERVCEGCGDCGVKSNCLSVQPVETPFGRKTQVHQSSCNYDYSCMEGDCPSFVTVEVGQGDTEGPDTPACPVPAMKPPAVAEPPARPEGPHGTLLAGVGGTGVVTVNQILAMAAQLDGRRVVGLDQTGLSQKAGPVVSHLRVLDGEPIASPRVTASSTDALILLDTLVGTQASTLDMASPGRTVAVVATRVAPTGAMVTDVNATTPSAESLRQQIDQRTRSEANVYVDAADIAETLLGSHMFANMVVVGAALQAGVLPVSLAALVRAIQLNGTEVANNLDAIAWGRAVVAAPSEVQAALASARMSPTDAALAPARTSAAHRLSATTQTTLASSDLPLDVADLVSHRASDLVGYQDQRLAQRYVDKVLQVWNAEQGVDPTGTVTLTAARYLHKVLAYKDEYEVARLYRDPAWLESVRAEFPDASKVRIQLHPPVLRALGMRRKVGIGGWAQPGFDALYRLRRLRGSWMDPFGHTRVRTAERRLIATYLDDLNLIISTLSVPTLAEATELAALPDLVRGYEAVKLKGIAALAARRPELRESLVAAARGGDTEG